MKQGALEVSSQTKRAATAAPSCLTYLIQHLRSGQVETVELGADVHDGIASLKEESAESRSDARQHLP